MEHTLFSFVEFGCPTESNFGKQIDTGTIVLINAGNNVSQIKFFKDKRQRELDSLRTVTHVPVWLIDPDSQIWIKMRRSYTNPTNDCQIFEAHDGRGESLLSSFWISEAGASQANFVDVTVEAGLAFRNWFGDSNAKTLLETTGIKPLSGRRCGRCWRRST